MKINRKLLMIVIAAASVWVGCKKDDDLVPVPPPVENEQEIITTLKLTFVDSSNGSNIKYATFRDPDGDGSVSPNIWDSIKLEQNKTWNVSVTLLNELASPIDTISNEVMREAVDHILCYTPSGTSAAVTATDKDANNRPVGLKSRWKTGNSGTGTMQIVLKHQPGNKDGSCTPGETDVDVTFQIKVQ